MLSGGEAKHEKESNEKFKKIANRADSIELGCVIVVGKMSSMISIAPSRCLTYVVPTPLFNQLTEALNFYRIPFIRHMKLDFQRICL